MKIMDTGESGFNMQVPVAVEVYKVACLPVSDVSRDILRYIRARTLMDAASTMTRGNLVCPPGSRIEEAFP